MSIFGTNFLSHLATNTGLAQPLTDAQLRASAVPVSGPITDAQLRASNVPVAPDVTKGAWANDSKTQRVTLASDGPGVQNLQSIKDNQTNGTQNTNIASMPLYMQVQCK